MYTVSNLYTSIISSPSHWYEYQVEIGGVMYGMDKLKSVKPTYRMFADNQPSVGGCLSGELELSVINSGAVPRMAEVRPYVRAALGAQRSEWIPQGVFYIDTRETTRNDDGLDVLTIHCFDAMLKTEDDYPSTSHDWPVDDIDVVREIAGTIGVSVDQRTEDIMISGYQIGLPAGYSMREVLSNIAAMYAGNWVMTYDGELRLISLTELPEETNYLVDSAYDAITFGSGQTETVDSGDVVSFDALWSNPFHALTVDIDVVQSGSGDPSTSNIRPIVLHDGVSVWDDPLHDEIIDFNQLAPLDLTGWSKRYIVVSHEDNTIKLSVNSTGTAMKYVYKAMTQNHVYAVTCDSVTCSSGSNAFIGVYSAPASNDYDSRTTVGRGASFGRLYTSAETNRKITFAYTTSQKTGVYTTLENFMVFDLTQMFGAGNEPSTIEDFQALLTSDYYPYNVGEETCISAVNDDEYWVVSETFEEEVAAGSFDVLSGELKARPYYESYNGEELVGPWVSSMDVYAPNTTPTTGAQVVDLGGTETVYNLSEHDVASFQGHNNIFGNTGDVHMDYIEGGEAVRILV